MSTRSYSEMIQLATFDERFEYLRLKGAVGESTFGFDRWINQDFYRSAEWKRIRQRIIARDLGRDLADEEHQIYDRVIIHHMNPMTIESIVEGNPDVLNPEYLICVSHDTHNAIHYGDASLLKKDYIPRRPGDTKLW